jgi:NADH-quinone oxidoreductase subunit G
MDLEMSEGRLDRYGTNFDNWVNEDNKIDCTPTWELMNNLAKRLGLSVQFGSSREIMDEIASSVSTFEGVSFERMDDENGIQLTGITKEEVSA